MMPKLNLKKKDSPFDHPLNRDQQGWIFSIISIGAGISAVAAGSLADQIGRKLTLMVATLFFIAAYATTALLTTVEILYLGRLLQGFGAGTALTVVPMYVGEIATKDVRGSLLSLMALFMTIGILFIAAFGPYTHYDVTQLSCLAVSTLTFCGYLLIPESPFYLVSLGEIDKALESLEIVRGQDIETVKRELPEIQAAIEETNSMTKGKCSDVIQNPANRRAMIICIGLMVFQQFSGSVIMVINAQSIFIMSHTILDSVHCSITVAAVQVFSSTTLQFLVDSFKRRTLLRLSALGMGIAHLILGTFFYVNAQRGVSQLFHWLPLFAFLLFQFSYRIGFGPLPFTILGEVFPKNVKAIAATSATLTYWGLGFLIARFYPLYDALGSHFVFWTFSIFCGLAFLFAQFIVVETKNYTLTEIQGRLRKLAQ